MGWEQLRYFSIATILLLLFACSGREGGGRTVTASDASTDDASWSCEVGSYYECAGPGGCSGAAQCITGGDRLGECRCISAPTDAGMRDAPPTIDNRVCEPGQMYACSGAGGCAGQAACENDGRSLGICDCPDAAVAPDASLGNGRCSNANDQSGLQQSYALGTVEQTRSFCELTCSLEEMPSPTCVVDCVYSFTGGAVSRGCLSCYDTKSTCDTNNGCALLCLLGEPDCENQCSCGAFGGANCAEAFDNCTGLASNTCS